jgi:deazaflavin-dependent oxidoreductase (nitroreductase family)
MSAESRRPQDAEDSSDPGSRAPHVEPASAPPELVVRIVNPLLGLLLRSPLHGLVSDHLLLVTVTGRKSGTEYTFPVGYEQDDGTLLVTSHGTNWWKNLRDGGQDVEVVLRGERRTGHATVEEDDRAVAQHVHRYLQREGTGAAGRVGLSVDDEGVPSVESLTDVVGHVVVVRIELE